MNIVTLPARFIAKWNVYHSQSQPAADILNFTTAASLKILPTSQPFPIPSSPPPPYIYPLTHLMWLASVLLRLYLCSVLCLGTGGGSSWLQAPPEPHRTLARWDTLGNADFEIHFGLSRHDWQKNNLNSISQFRRHKNWGRVNISICDFVWLGGMLSMFSHSHNVIGKCQYIIRCV